MIHKRTHPGPRINLILTYLSIYPPPGLQLRMGGPCGLSRRRLVWVPTEVETQTLSINRYNSAGCRSSCFLSWPRLWSRTIINGGDPWTSPDYRSYLQWWRHSCSLTARALKSGELRRIVGRGKMIIISVNYYIPTGWLWSLPITIFDPGDNNMPQNYTRHYSSRSHSRFWGFYFETH